jgi:predicted DCC family thiol-disulfide oxidoreductase YuxK
MAESREPQATSDEIITVYYDGACPSCVRDRQMYERLAGKEGEQVCWFDITGQEQALKDQGVDPGKALRELHVRDRDGGVVSELDAYILLMGKVWLLKPLAWLIGRPLIRPRLARAYRNMVDKRLRETGRI